MQCQTWFLLFFVKQAAKKIYLINITKLFSSQNHISRHKALITRLLKTTKNIVVFLQSKKYDNAAIFIIFLNAIVSKQGKYNELSKTKTNLLKKKQHLQKATGYGSQKRKYQLAIMASGSGSNAQCFIDYFCEHPAIEVAVVISNNSGAYVLKRAEDAGIPAVVVRKSEWNDQEAIKNLLLKYKVDAIVLAGYLLLLPSWLIEMFPGRIFNIHPALLPEFGGKGMYGINVHRAVIDSGAKQSGITIHLVNEAYDEGEILFQEKLEVLPEDTPESLASRVLKLEHQHYPRVVECYLTRLTVQS